MRGKVGTAVTAGVALLLGMFVTADAASVRVRCEKRADRSKISVDGNDLAAGSYTATATSGASSVTAAAKNAVGDEVEFDFDSNAIIHPGQRCHRVDHQRERTDRCQLHRRLPGQALK